MSLNTAWPHRIFETARQLPYSTRANLTATLLFDLGYDAHAVQDILQLSDVALAEVETYLKEHPREGQIV